MGFLEHKTKPTVFSHRTIGGAEFLAKAKNQVVLLFFPFCRQSRPRELFLSLLFFDNLFGNIEFFHVAAGEETDLGGVSAGTTVNNGIDWH